MQKFSLLMSIYIKENPAYLRACIDSILAQTVLPDEIILCEDGPLTDELHAVIADWQAICPALKILAFPENRGLGKTLNDGLAACSYPLVARMDTDDIAFPDRFERQLAAFEADPDLDLLSGQVLEIEGSIDNILRRKRLPVTHEEIVRYAARRNPMNHPCVMYKKDTVLVAGSYQHVQWYEDYDLWARMIAMGAKTANIDDFILYFRTGSDLYKRRGGFAYAKASVKARWRIHRHGVSSLYDFLYATAAQVVVGLMPNSLRGKFYDKVLRK